MRKTGISIVGKTEMKRGSQLWEPAVGKIALVGLGLILLAGCGGGQSSSDTGGTAATTPTTTPPTMPGGMGKFGPGGPAAAMGGAPFGGMGGAALGRQQTSGSTGNQQVASVITGKYHQDPFLVTWKKKPLPPDVFAEVQPLQVADTTVQAPPEKPVVVQQVPDRRVAGIMRGNGIYAILEQNGQSEIVKPGSLTSDNYRVLTITDDAVKLEKREGNLILVENVKLSDLQTAAQTMGTTPYPGYRGYPGYGGYPGYPGAPGGMGRPGLPRPGAPSFGGGGGNVPGGSD
ncbi:hypothetical protein CTKA_02797 [Chthonomonas calidirosea]|uniref:Uncharacterized protein n=2 Tax=Chthonomonas TaxID=1077265 RepID=S0EU11_CHTCT|nr:hypothetical protein CCALI_01302 [Chthonomonas calidirosea T49]CEK20863.1 hypothetical protein CTKA_02797 [Chthonomonas calidirosea]